MHVGLHDDRQQGPVDAAARFQQRREERALPQLGDAQLDITGLGGQQPPAGAVAMGGACVGALVPASADVLGGLGVDQGLQHQGQALADDVQVTASTQRIQQISNGRLVQAIVANSLV